MASTPRTQKLSWSAPIPARALRYILAGTSAGLVSILAFAGIIVLTVTG